jgi:hypothetical protein
MKDKAVSFKDSVGFSSPMEYLMISLVAGRVAFLHAVRLGRAQATYATASVPASKVCISQGVSCCLVGWQFSQHSTGYYGCEPCASVPVNVPWGMCRDTAACRSWKRRHFPVNNAELSWSSNFWPPSVGLVERWELDR